MTGFEVLAYIAAFAILFLIATFIGIIIYAYIERKKHFNNFLKIKKKDGRKFECTFK